MITLTLTPLVVLGINFKSVIGALWVYTCTLEITLTLLNCFQINFPKITLTLTLLLVLNYKCNLGAPKGRPFFRGDNRNWSFPSESSSSLCDCSIRAHCHHILISLRKHGQEESRPLPKESFKAIFKQ